MERVEKGGDTRILKVKVSGLKGGHSGIDINVGRASANKVLGRCLYKALGAGDYQILAVKGGNKRNSIADAAEAYVAVPEKRIEKWQALCSEEADTIIEEFSKTDSGLTVDIEVDATAPTEKVLPAAHTKKVINLLIALPHGVITMSPEVEGLVETSTNLGVMELLEDRFTVTMLTRSAVTSHLRMIKDRIKVIADILGGTVQEPRGYPGWKPDMDSEILKVAKEVYKEKYGEYPAIKAIHAGLECGLFSEKLPGADMLSIGPEMHHVHSPAEELEIESVGKTYELLKDIIRAFTR